MSKFIDQLHAPVDESWNQFLTKNILETLHTIEHNVLEAEFTPDITRVLHFLTIPLVQTRVIILGQDPYPQPDVATGRAFEVGTLADWNHPFRNVSLKNIVRLIYKTYYGKILAYKSIIEWNDKTNEIAGPQELFKKWESQGVLLLNTAFTCQTGKSNSHSKLWKPFSHQLLQFINQQNPGLTWVLWGGHAQNITAEIDIIQKTTSDHPMMCSPKRTNDFLFGKNNTLSETRHLIDWRGNSETKPIA